MKKNSLDINAVSHRAFNNQRPRVQLVPPHRALICIALIGLVVSAVLYLIVARITVPILGIGYVDAGGFYSIDSPIDGYMTSELYPGEKVIAGQSVASVLASDGKVLNLTALHSGVVSQMRVPGGRVQVKSGDSLMNVLIDSAPRNVVILLPGEQSTEMTKGDVSNGDAVWLEPAGKKAISCVIGKIAPYPQFADELKAISPDPVVRDYLTERTSVTFAYAKCPDKDIAALPLSRPFKVSVLTDPRSPIAVLFGGGR